MNKKISLIIAVLGLLFLSGCNFDEQMIESILSNEKLREETKGLVREVLDENCLEVTKKFENGSLIQNYEVYYCGEPDGENTINTINGTNSTFEGSIVKWEK